MPQMNIQMASALMLIVREQAQEADQEYPPRRIQPDAYEESEQCEHVRSRNAKARCRDSGIGFGIVRQLELIPALGCIGESRPALDSAKASAPPWDFTMRCSTEKTRKPFGLRVQITAAGVPTENKHANEEYFAVLTNS